ncbi:hypothetical protein HpDR115_10960 [Helicobacter pylori]
MLDSLNNINFNNISNNKNIGIELGFEIQEASWVKSPFKSITGRGSDRGIRTYAVKNAQPYRPRLKAPLSGSGVSGNTDFEANYDKLEILSQTIYPEVFGNALASQILGVLEGKLNAITESVVKNLDFSFLKTQPQLFYSAINENLKEMFLKELKSEYLQKYINSVIESYFEQAEKLKLLRETELKALCYLQVVLESNKVKALQDALMLENQNIQNELKIQNEIAYNEKRKQLIADGQLEDEAFKQFKFRVI